MLPPSIGAEVMPAAFVTQSGGWVKIVVSADIALDFPGGCSGVLLGS